MSTLIAILLFLILYVLLLYFLLFWLIGGRGFPCLFCDLFGPHKPVLGSDRLPPRRGSIRLPSDVYKRPDPLIYSQQFLMSQGVAVTWDNPDIRLETVGADGKPSGTIVPSSALTADTDYFVIARIWNGSVEAPAINLPVYPSYLTFGIGTTETPVGMTHVDLPAKGVAGCPAFAVVKWHTPPAAGHYCLQVKLVWPDDAEPGNNLGQENTDVKALNSPHAAFTFPVRNDSGMRRILRLEPDFYGIAARPLCDPEQARAANPHLTADEIARLRRAARAEHGRGQFPVAAGWTVTVQPEQLELAAGEEQEVTVDVTAPDGFNGQQAININAFAGDTFTGGVTLVVTGDGH